MSANMEKPMGRREQFLAESAAERRTESERRKEAGYADAMAILAKIRSERSSTESTVPVDQPDSHVVITKQMRLEAEALARRDGLKDE